MKKSLAIICALAVLISSICGTFMLASANDTTAPSLVVMPTYKDATGNPINLIGGEASVPTTVVDPEGMAGSVANSANLPFSNLFEITNAMQSASIYRDIFITPAAGKGAILYVDAPDVGDVLRLGAYALHENGTAYVYGYTSWYMLKEGDTEWKLSDVWQYGVDVNGFKGYIYIPFATLNAYPGGMVTTGSKITGLRIFNEYGGRIPANDPLLISAPVIVDGAADDQSLPSASKVTDGTNEYTYFAEKKTDFTANEIVIVNPAQFGGELTVGETAPTTVVATPDASVTHTVVASAGGVTGLPDIKISYNGTSEVCLVSFNQMSKEAAKGAVGFMNYFKLSDEARKFRLTIKGCDSANADINSYIFDGVAWILPDGATNWTELTIDDYWFELPANFSGYVKFSFAESLFANAIDTIVNLYDVHYFTDSAIAVEKAVTIGMPVHIYQDADTNVCMIGKALDMSTGQTVGQVTGGGVASDDSSDDSSSDNTSSDDTSSDTSSAPSDVDDPNATVVMPSYNGVTLNGGEASIPTTVVDPVGMAGSVANSANLPFSNLFEITNAMQSASVYRDIYITPAAGKGAILYVDAPNVGDVLRLGAYALHENGTAYVYGYTGWYMLKEGDTAWQSVGVEQYGVDVNGFKGYIYIPFATQSLGNTVTTGSKITGLRIFNEYGGRIPANDPLLISAPVIVKGEVDTDLSALVLPSATSVVTSNGEFTFFGDGNDGSSEDTSSDTSSDVSSDDSSSDNTSSDDTSSDTSSTPADVEDPNATVVMPSYNGVTLNGGEASIPTTVVDPVGMAGSVANSANLPFSNLFEITNAMQSASIYRDIFITPVAGKGAILYVDAPDVGDVLRLGAYALHENGTAYVYGYTSWYMLKEGDTAWQSAGVEQYGVDVNGFKGYIYIPFATQSLGDAFTTGSKITGLRIFNEYGGRIPEDDPLLISAPVIVKGEVDTDLSALVLPSATSVVTSNGEFTFFANENDDSSDDTSSGGSTPSNPTGPAAPDYKLPYDGEAIDYTGISIMKATVGKLSGVVTIGGNLADVGIITNKDGTIEAIASANKLTNYPSFKINVDTIKAKFTDEAPFVAYMTLDEAVSPKNPTEVMYYVEMPGDKEMKVSVNWNFISENGYPYYCNFYNGNCYIMSEGDSDWTRVEVNTYKFTLPAGFKGYIKFKLSAISVAANSPAYGYAYDEGLTTIETAQEYFAADETKYLATTNFGVSESSASQSIIVSAPLIVTESGSAPNVAFVDGDTRVARNIFTGEIVSAESLKDYKGQENLNTGAAPEVNYNIPKYTGTKYQYGNYEFARVRQFVLKENIHKGYAIHVDAFYDGHPDNNNAYTKLVDTTLGISKMPLFSITKSTGKPNTTDPVELGVWHPDPEVAANAGPGAIMQYLKLPAGLEKPFVQLTMNFFDKDNMAKNVAPYNGVIYYMDKNSTEWVSAKITAYWFELPKGFEGYILLETKPLITQGDGEEFAADWQLYNYNVNIANLDNMTVIASAPFWVEKKGDIDYACYLNDETNAVRNIFTGKILKTEDVIKPLKIGDTIVKLPDFTTDLSASIADKDALANGTASVKWDSIDNAAKYIVRVFKKVSTDDGVAYNFVAEAETTETSVTINDLELNTQYAIVVYAYDAKGNEIAVFDYINASTAGGAGGAPVTKPTTPSTPTAPEESGINWLLIAIIAGGVVVLAGVAVAVVIVIKKRKAKA